MSVEASPISSTFESGDVSQARALHDAQSRLRPANDQLDFLYAVEQQISCAHDIASLVEGVLECVQSAFGFEVAAALITDAATAEVYVVPRGGPLRPRGIEVREALRLLDHARTPLRRLPEPGGTVVDLLSDPPSGRVQDACSAPLADGRTQIGILQCINGPTFLDEDTLLRKLGLAAAQLGRAIVLHREREALERAERLRLLSRAMEAITHECATPLWTARGSVDALMEESSAELREAHAARAGRALAQLERALQDVTAFARGQREVTLAPVQLDHFVDELRELLGPELERSATELHWRIEYTGPARFDQNKLKRVLWNLARNAGQAGASRFTITIARSGEQLLFECHDDGPGIARARQQRLFEPFATLGAEESTGFGLAMAKTIVDAHRGRIEVNSNPGHGTLFRVEIPI
jgi:signal transduction histidine kinase